MSSSDFGLSFTVSQPALWNELNKVGEAGTIFADIVVLDKIGEA